MEGGIVLFDWYYKYLSRDNARNLNYVLHHQRNAIKKATVQQPAKNDSGGLIAGWIILGVAVFLLTPLAVLLYKFFSIFNLQFIVVILYLIVFGPWVAIMIIMQSRHNKNKANASMQPPVVYRNYSYQTTLPSTATMTGHDFERYCADLLPYNGFYNVTVTKGSGDKGIDILASRDGALYAIQTKLYSGTVGFDAVKEAHTGKALYNCHFAVVLTNSTFTKSAIESACRLGVGLWDKNILYALEQGKARAAQQYYAPQIVWPITPPNYATPTPSYQHPQSTSTTIVQGRSSSEEIEHDTSEQQQYETPRQG